MEERCLLGSPELYFGSYVYLKKWGVTYFPLVMETRLLNSSPAVPAVRSGANLQVCWSQGLAAVVHVGCVPASEAAGGAQMAGNAEHHFRAILRHSPSTCPVLSGTPAEGLPSPSPHGCLVSIELCTLLLLAGQEAGMACPGQYCSQRETTVTPRLSERHGIKAVWLRCSLLLEQGLMWH